MKTTKMMALWRLKVHKYKKESMLLWTEFTLHVTDMSAYTLRRGLLHGGKKQNIKSEYEKSATMTNTGLKKYDLEAKETLPFNLGPKFED